MNFLKNEIFGSIFLKQSFGFLTEAPKDPVKGMIESRESLELIIISNEFSQIW